MFGDDGLIFQCADLAITMSELKASIPLDRFRL